METYILTNRSAFEGDVIITYDYGRFQADFTQSTVSLGQQKFILSKMSTGLRAMLDYFNNKSEGSKCVKLAITFELFWEKYDDKICSSKKKTLARWNKMTPSEQTKAYNYVGIYLASLGQGIRQKYAETYLNSEIWNN